MSFDFAKADSLWNDDSSSPYTPQKAYKVGDIVHILIVENTTAQNKAGTKTDTSDDLSLKFNHTIERLTPTIGQNNTVAGAWANRYAGSGQTSRTSNVQARVSAWVTDVLPNGNLSIKGRHKLDINDDTQEITVTGIIRPKDISIENTVYSYQVANADLMVKGKGVLSEAESPGWITRILNWIF